MTSAAVVTNGACRPCGSATLVERDDDEASAEEADDGAQHRLLDELHQHVTRRACSQRDVFDQHQGEEDREGIVGAGFRLQRRTHARAQAQALGVHQQEHGGGVGRGHHRADQQRLRPVEVERPFGERRRDQRGQEHADGREHHGGREHGADAGKARPQAAVEQDQRQRHRADQIGGADVVELELPGTGIARQHADHEEDEQQGRAEAQRKQARQDTGHHQDGAEQYGEADRVEGGHPPSGYKSLELHPYRRGIGAPTHFLPLAAICPCFAALTRITCRCIDGPAAPFVGFCGSLESNPTTRPLPDETRWTWTSKTSWSSCRRPRAASGRKSPRRGSTCNSA